MPSFRKSLWSLCSTSTSSPVVALVVDPYASQALEIAKDLNILYFVYFPLSARTTSFQLHFPIVLHEQVSCEYKDILTLFSFRVVYLFVAKIFLPNFFMIDLVLLTGFFFYIPRTCLLLMVSWWIVSQKWRQVQWEPCRRSTTKPPN